ncbi:S8 family serine peptidase [Sutcliffiella rhizosphaerae]|uniref:Peptidase S8/S53 domain-containing protein n=1 Tax=Sutcliffiella rhizosphaerae TaxID=2880967 RepID=A0ABN8AIZ6_9BACI|nr:S8 family serine peptidase [Sutcliffiella rhizosphaerae]CAG9623697.1 hypothetical protein BACCIP111883_04529 [Sutcliffiella rhizosphaerae]
MDLDWRQKKGENINIVILDSGVSSSHPKFKNIKFRGISITDTKKRYKIEDDVIDKLGHGTAVTSIIKKLVPNSNITIIKIFQDDFFCTEEKLIFALNYVLTNVNCDILHLSLGVTTSSEKLEMFKICEKLSQKGVIIVSAFDNGGALSYPASFKNVIGVDTSSIVKADYEYEYVASEIINIRAKGSFQRVSWTNPEYIIMHGTSFAAAYVSGYVAKIMQTGKRSMEEVLNQLFISATYCYKENDTYLKDNMDFLKKIKKAVVFPFNKEVHSLIRYKDLLSFNLCSVYSSKYLGHVGRSTSKILPGEIDYTTIIKNLDDIDWNNDDFDTFILGHTNLLDTKLKKDLKREILINCIKYNKNVYSFDDLSSYKEIIIGGDKSKEIFFPNIDETTIPQHHFGKLQKISKPVLGVFGTSSKQGKFSLQLTLRKLFVDEGYSVGQLGTEPSSLLFGMNEVYPMGFNSNVKVSSSDAIKVLNNMMGKIEDTNPDIIIVGSQSGTIPYDTSNLSSFTIPQTEFIFGTLPDAIILCVNFEDELKYIKSTINFLENIIDTKVLGLVLYPIRNLSSPIFTNSNSISIQELNNHAENLSKYTGINTFILGEKHQMESLFEEIINFYSEEKEVHV